MANLGTEQFVVELIFDDSQLESGLQKLVKSGAIDSKVADAFKEASTEIKKTSDSLNPLNKNLDTLRASTKAVSQSFTQGFSQAAVKNITNATTATKTFSDALKKSSVVVKERIDLSGKLTLSQTKEQAAYNKVVASLKSLTGEGLKSAKALLQFTPGQVAASFDELGVSVDEFIATLKEGAPAALSLRQELKLTVQALAELKLQGDDTSETYVTLKQRAGEIKDALADVNAEIKDAGSDTQGLDNLLGTAQAVTAGFAVAQGAAGLFGDESEELQKTLLKVNSAMAVLQGLQQIQTALQKEGAITLAITNVQQKIRNAQLIIETALESKSIVVRGLATAAQWALNAAMAANPIGLVVTAIAGLVTALYFYNSAANESARITGELNKALEDTGEGFEESAANIRKLGELRNAELLKNGAKQSEILRANARDEELIAENRINARKALEARVAAAQASRDRTVREEANKAQAELRKLDDLEFQDRLDKIAREAEIRKVAREEDLQSAAQIAERRALLAQEGTPQQLAAQKAAIQARLALELNAEGQLEEEKATLRTKALKEQQQLDADYRKRRLEGQVKDIETALINVEAGTVEEFNLRNNLIAKQRDAELTNLKLSEKEKKAIIAESAAEQAKLKRDYDRAVVQEAIAAQVRYNNATLDLLKTNDEDRLALAIDNIELLAGAEVEAAEGNASKIKEINAQRDADILAVRKDFILQAAKYEADLAAVDNAPTRRLLEKRLNDQTAATLKQKLSAIDQLRDIDVAAIDAEIATLDKLYADRLISDKDYELQRKQLLDDRVAANEQAEDAITLKTREANRQRTELILQSAAAVLGILAQMSDSQAAQENAAIEFKRRELEELEKAGAITEKNAIERAKRIDQEERANKRRQAVREKNLAIFDAVLNTAQGITNAISTGDPYTAALRAAIVAAIGAAQIAVINSRPIPQFNVGKTKFNKYEGPGELAETGHAEILERDGRMYVVKKPTIVDLRKDDVVHTPHQTRKLLARHGSTVDRGVVKYKPGQAATQIIDYDKQAAAFAKHIKTLPTTNVSLDKDGLNIWVKQGQDALRYWANRYNSNGK